MASLVQIGGLGDLCNREVYKPVGKQLLGRALHWILSGERRLAKKGRQE